MSAGASLKELHRWLLICIVEHGEMGGCMGEELKLFWEVFYYLDEHETVWVIKEGGDRWPLGLTLEEMFSVARKQKYSFMIISESQVKILCKLIESGDMALRAVSPLTLETYYKYRLISEELYHMYLKYQEAIDKYNKTLLKHEFKNGDNCPFCNGRLDDISNGGRDYDEVILKCSNERCYFNKDVELKRQLYCRSRQNDT